MKKILTLLFAMLLSTAVMAASDTPINVKITGFGNTLAGTHYCLEVNVGYDVENDCGIPISLGTDFINIYLIGITAGNNKFIKFAYSKAQLNAHWPSQTCSFPLTQSANLTVNITPAGCTITT